MSKLTNAFPVFFLSFNFVFEPSSALTSIRLWQVLALKISRTNVRH